MKRSTKVGLGIALLLGLGGMFAVAGLAHAKVRGAALPGAGGPGDEAADSDFFVSPEACASWHMERFREACSVSPACRRLSEKDFAEYRATLLYSSCHPKYLARAAEELLNQGAHSN